MKVPEQGSWKLCAQEVEKHLLWVSSKCKTHIPFLPLVINGWLPLLEGNKVIFGEMFKTFSLLSKHCPLHSNILHYKQNRKLL